LIEFEQILSYEMMQDWTWREYLTECASIAQITDANIYPIVAYQRGMDVPSIIGFCVKNDRKHLFVDYELPSVLRFYYDTLKEFIDTTIWKTKAECFLYHGVAIVADEKVQDCSNEFGLLEAYMASYRGNYANYQELATEPNL
jgi:hypothetical protein